MTRRQSRYGRRDKGMIRWLNRYQRRSPWRQCKYCDRATSDAKWIVWLPDYCVWCGEPEFMRPLPCPWKVAR